MNSKVEKAVEQVRTFSHEERKEFLTWLAEDERKRNAMVNLKNKIDEALVDEPVEWTRQDIETIRQQGKELVEKRRAAKA